MPEPTCPHCGTKITEHPATLCLSAWVAEMCMGWEVRSRDFGWSVYINGGWAYSIGNHHMNAFFYPHVDIAAAMEVVEQITASVGESLRYTALWWMNQDKWYEFEINDSYEDETIGFGETAPLAICRCAILAAAKEKAE